MDAPSVRAEWRTYPSQAGKGNNSESEWDVMWAKGGLFVKLRSGSVDALLRIQETWCCVGILFLLAVILLFAFQVAKPHPFNLAHDSSTAR